MKTMKHILLIICIACTTTAMAVDYQVNTAFHGSQDYSSTHAQHDATLATTPEVVFRSTSAMPSIGSHLSAAEGLDIGDDTPAPTGPRRVGPNTPPADPFDDPLGDAVIPLLLLAVGYSIYLRRKNSVRTPDAGHNQ